MPRKPASGGEPETLETRLARLDAIVATLEGRDLELEDALRLFEEGVGHIRQAQEAIRQAELRIERLIETPDGRVTSERIGGDGPE